MNISSILDQNQKLKDLRTVMHIMSEKDSTDTLFLALIELGFIYHRELSAIYHELISKTQSMQETSSSGDILLKNRYLKSGILRFNKGIGFSALCVLLLFISLGLKNSPATMIFFVLTPILLWIFIHLSYILFFQQIVISAAGISVFYQWRKKDYFLSKTAIERVLISYASAYGDFESNLKLIIYRKRETLVNNDPQSIIWNITNLIQNKEVARLETIAKIRQFIQMYWETPIEIQNLSRIS